MKTKYPTLPDRINYLLDGRKLYPWAQSIGISKGSIEGVMKLGGMLGGDALSAIGRCENARVDWLLEARGKPYLVNCVTSDEEAKEVLEDLLIERWNITIVSDGKRIALVLVQPGSFDVKDGKDDDGAQRFRTIGYPIVEVIAGVIGHDTMDLVRGLAKQETVRMTLATPDVMTQIERGMIGTRRLFQAPGALLEAAEVINAKHRIFTQFNQQELFPVTKDEAILLDHYRTMPPESRLAVNQVATAMAEHGDHAAVKAKES